MYVGETGAVSTLDAQRDIDEQIPTTVRQAEIRETDRGYCIARSVTRLEYGEKRLNVFDAKTWPMAERLWFQDKGEAELGMESLKDGKIPTGYLPTPYEQDGDEGDDEADEDDGFMDFASVLAADEEAEDHLDDEDDDEDDDEEDDW